MHYYFPGMAVGLILMQTAIVARSLFKTLEINDFGRAIRDIWPKFFIALGTIGLASTISLISHDGAHTIHYIIAISTVIFSLICYLIIPATNNATDTGNKKLFSLLHRVSVSLTVIMLLSNIGFLFV